MKAVIHLFGNDARLLYRSGYIWASVAVFALLLLAALQAQRLDFAGYEDFIAAIILFDIVLSPVMLVGLMVLLERGEGAFAVLSVSPAPAGAYISARVLLVSLIAMAEMFVLVLTVYDAPLSPLLLALGLAGAAAVAALLGFAIVAFYDDLYAFILPMIAAIMLLGAPGYGVWFGLDPGWLAWHPTAASLALIEAAFAPGFGAAQVYAVLGVLLWIAASAVLAYWAVRRMRARIGGA